VAALTADLAAAESASADLAAAAEAARSALQEQQAALQQEVRRVAGGKHRLHACHGLSVCFSMFNIERCRNSRRLCSKKHACRATPTVDGTCTALDSLQN
jgi:hypothetical protein